MAFIIYIGIHYIQKKQHYYDFSQHVSNVFMQERKSSVSEIYKCVLLPWDRHCAMYCGLWRKGEWLFCWNISSWRELVHTICSLSGGATLFRIATSLAQFCFAPQSKICSAVDASAYKTLVCIKSSRCQLGKVYASLIVQLLLPPRGSLVACQVLWMINGG